MKRREWSQVHVMGLTVVDGQHRRLYKLYNELYDEVLDGAPEVRLVEGLGELLDRTEEHFISEEYAMERMGYPGIAEHRHAHARLLTYGRHLQSKLIAGQERFSRAIMSYLGNWLERHLENEDQSFAVYVKAKMGAPDEAFAIPIRT